MSKEIDCRKKLRITYNNMKMRCYNEKNKDYPNYGGKGIKLCERWYDLAPIRIRKNGGRPSNLGFENFFDDMEETWFPGATIDRIDNDGDYTPENCQWLSKSDNVKKEVSALLKEKKHIFQKPGFQRDNNLQRSASGKPPGFKKDTVAVYDLSNKKYTRVLSEEYRKNKDTLYLNPAVAKKRGF